MAKCPYCGDSGRPYGNGKLICVRCGSTWNDPSASSRNSGTNYSSSGSSSGNYSSHSDHSGSSGCGPMLLAVGLGAFIGYKVGGSTGAIVGLVIGIFIAAKM